MKKLLSRSLPWQISWLGPATVLFLMYLVVGAAPLAAVIGGVVGGLVGLFGAALAELVRVLQARRREEAEVDAVAKATQERHDGLRRMHEDIARDEQRRRQEPRVGPPDYEPPERG